MVEQRKLTKGADWQHGRLHPAAVPIEDNPPPRDCELLVWVDDADVSIYCFPTVARWDGHEWWAGLPGKWIGLGALRWQVTHWLRITDAGRAALNQEDSNAGR